MVLSDKDIKININTGKITIERDGDLYIGPSSVDLHLSGEAKVFLDKNKENGSVIDTKKDNSSFIKTFSFEDSIIIKPGEFYLLSTEEKITFGDKIAGFLQGRSSLARIGLNIHNAGYFDAGFSGTATLEVTNFTKCPIVLYKGMRICQMVFVELSSKCEVPYGKKADQKYQNQKSPKESAIHKDNE